MITAIVTVYYPDENNIDNIKKIAKEVDKIYICDNTPQNVCREFESISNCKYYANKANRGLSVAMNIPLKDESNVWNEEDLVIFFDQDSTIFEGYISGIVNEFKYIENKGWKLGALGSFYYNTSNSTIEIPRQKKQITEHSYLVKYVITSSMLCKYGVLKKINFWNEDIFLDLADFDLCWRLGKQGYVCGKTDVVTLKHTLGKGEWQKGKMRIRYGAALREYYQVRDALYLLEKKYTPLKFRIRIIISIIFRIVIHTRVLDEPEKRKMYIKRAFKDYRLRVHGEFRE